MTIQSVYTTITQCPRDSRSPQDQSIQHSLLSPRTRTYGPFGYCTLLSLPLKQAPAERRMQSRSNSVCSSTGQVQLSSCQSASMPLPACVATYDSSNVGTALGRKHFVQPWTKGDDKKEEANQVAHQWSSVVTSQK